MAIGTKRDQVPRFVRPMLRPEHYVVDMKIVAHATTGVAAAPRVSPENSQAQCFIFSSRKSKGHLILLSAHHNNLRHWLYLQG